MELIGIFLFVAYVVCMRCNVEILCKILGIEEEDLELGKVPSEKMKPFPFILFGFFATPILLFILFMREI